MRRRHRRWPFLDLADFGIHSQLKIPLIAGLLLVGASTLRAEDALPEIKLAGGHFEPQELSLPANTPVKLRVTNAENAAVEFESFELHRERVIQPGETITVYLPALDSGSYKFFDDFHRDTPEGTIVVK